MTGDCPCGRAGTFGGTLRYDRCCGRYLGHGPDEAGSPAPDAESLMRSRYTAFALGRPDYLLATWDARHAPDELVLDPALSWQGLRVLDHRTTGPDTAEVEFEARYTDAGRRGRLHERSRFVRRDGRWYYLDGRIDPA